MAILNFLGSTAGRWARGIIGVALIVLAIVLGGGWLWLIALGAFFILVAILDICVLAPIFGRALKGKEFRSGK